VTLVPFHRAILATDQWRDAETCRDLLGDRKWLKSLEPSPDASPASRPGASGRDQGSPPERMEERIYQIEVDGRLHSVRVIGAAGANPNPNPTAGLRRPPRRERAARGAAGGGATETLVSPIQGTVLKVLVSNGDQVEDGALICVVEAMKMENEITAHRPGQVRELGVTEGGSVAAGDVIAKIE
jgi:acetyl-CoA/propionyl-CoA carboxylase biotin carboxyl carrier protein